MATDFRWGETGKNDGADRMDRHDRRRQDMVNTNQSKSSEHAQTKSSCPCQFESNVNQTYHNYEKVKDTPSITKENFRTKCYHLDNNFSEKDASKHLQEMKTKIHKIYSCSCTGPIPDNSYWTSRENSLELIETDIINKLSVRFLLQLERMVVTGSLGRTV